MTRTYCYCGTLYKDHCPNCGPVKQKSAALGYTNEHHRASRAYRAERPLCECCVVTVGVLKANLSGAMHHIHKIADRPDLRMKRSNWLALCGKCHRRLENDLAAGLDIKKRSEAEYHQLMHPGACAGGEVFYGQVPEA